ncbi:hypothetical protein GCM10010393_58930 [Streptomyces gobitricini]|uniref:Uncharacterized protein n=2 Tax=Streptomyces gobitricini TaxID=68211 RepID=A0ABP6ALG8_9ACTN
MTMRSIANPRRTTLMHLADAGQLDQGARPEQSVVLPASTANPRRTTLMDAPAPAGR